MLFRRRHGMSAPAREALAHVLAAPTFEIIPLRGALDNAASLPPGARVSVTASPIKGLEATVELCGQLQAAGFRAVPHISARMVRDRAHLTDLLAALEGMGVERAFVVGGDAKTPGDYPDGLSLLRAMTELGHAFAEIGIPCYPQGHPFIADEALLEALREKAAYASYMTSQLCFDPAAIGSWLDARRSEGITLPVHVGVPGVTEPHRLLAITARIGVADTHRFLTKNIRFVARLVRSGGFYRPDALLEALAPQMADERSDIASLHLYTFNAVQATERWRRGYLKGLTPDRPDPTAARPDSTATKARPTSGDAVP